MSAWDAKALVRRRPARARRPLLVVLAGALAAVALAPAAEATVDEQRKQLPPPAACADPVEGTWMSKTYYPRQREWYVFTFHIRRHGEDLDGDIDVRAWSGVATDPDPKPCPPGYYDWTVAEPGVGAIHGMNVEFTGSSWTLKEVRCAHGPTRYAIGRFAGAIDPALQEFQSVNRYSFDGITYEDLHVFRRIACVDPPPADTGAGVVATPPAVPPPVSPAPRSRLSCSCGP